MKVAFVASEMVPYAKTGGLADVIGTLPFSLAQLGVQVDVWIPHYSSVRSNDLSAEGARGVTVHFIHQDSYFHREGLYGNAHGDYPDNLERFSYFSRQVLVEIKKAGVCPDILHLHDWQTALVPVYHRTEFQRDPFFAQTKTLLTIHNLAYQGVFPINQYSLLGLPKDLLRMDGLEFYDKINFLKGGLLFAQALTTVSPTYAAEIQTAEHGSGLEGVIQQRSQDLVGILNGLDENVWNPATDESIAQQYDQHHLEEKLKNKLALQKQMKLVSHPRIPVLRMVSRFDSQKGFDLLLEMIPLLAKLNVQLVILGSGQKDIQESLEKAARFCRCLRVQSAFDQSLARRIYAGADLFLMPSRYEPCGLGQLIAMRYGTIPIVRATGGLVDTVSDYDPVLARGNGFCFTPYDADAFLGAIQRALDLYGRPKEWAALQRRGMKTDFSWEQSARHYHKLYSQLVNKKN